MKEERELFRTSSLTIRKQHVSTQSESELKTSTKRFTDRRFNNNEFLFNTSTESSNTAMMNSFEQDQDESSELQEDLRSKSSSSEMIFQQ